VHRGGDLRWDSIGEGGKVLIPACRDRITSKAINCEEGLRAYMDLLVKERKIVGRSKRDAWKEGGKKDTVWEA